MKQPTAPLYPDLLVEDERMNVLSVNHYTRSINVVSILQNGVDSGLISASVIMAGVGLAVPVMLPLEIAAIICVNFAASVKFVRCKLTSKAQKHYEVKTLAESKLNSVKDLISKDGKISELDIKMILGELEKYNE